MVKLTVITQFWKSIGKTGILAASKKRIPMEVVLGDGSVSLNIADILNKWKSDFGSLFRNVNPLADQAPEIDQNIVFSQEHDTYNEHISILDVKREIDDAKLGKASGIDTIPIEV